MEEVAQGNQNDGGSFESSQTVDPGAQEFTETPETEGFEAQDAEGQEGEVDSANPFKDGKEKFTIDGEEIEMDWEETKKSVQLARSSYKRFEDAKKLETTAQGVMTRMKELAQTNPEGLIRTLNPNWQPGSSAPSATAQHNDQRTQTEDNPWQRKFEESEERYKGLEDRFEEMDMQTERVKLQEEFTATQAKYPIFNDKASMVYLKAEYAKSLRAGMELGLDDVAFYVHQELSESRSKQIQSQKQRVEQRREKAPVSSRPAARSASTGGEESFDSLKRKLGMAY